MSRALQLVALELPDSIEAWTTAGFEASNQNIHVGDLEIRCGYPGHSATAAFVFDQDLAESEGGLDGIACSTEARPAAAGPGAEQRRHPNGINRIDHIVVLASSLERIRHVLEANHVDIRRVRDTTVLGVPAVQLFAWAGTALLEVVVTESAPDGPARLWGIAFESPDLEATANWFGDSASAIRPAVQSGRQILSVKHRELGMSITVAVMSPHHGPTPRT